MEAQTQDNEVNPSAEDKVGKRIDKICLWGAPTRKGIPGFRSMVEHEIGESCLDNIMINTVQQTDDRWRFELQSQGGEDLKGLLGILSDLGKRKGWFVRVAKKRARPGAVRPNIVPNEKAIEGAVVGVPCPPTPPEEGGGDFTIPSEGSLTVKGEEGWWKLVPKRRRAKGISIGHKIRAATLNINGAVSFKKRMLVVNFMIRHRLDVLCIQETQMKEGRQLRLPGYLVFEEPLYPGPSGRRGVAVAVRKDAGGAPIQWQTHSENIVAVQLTLADGASSLWVSLYLPQKHGMSADHRKEHVIARKRIWGHLRHLVYRWGRKFPKGLLFCGGDFNASTGEVIAATSAWAFKGLEKVKVNRVRPQPDRHTRVTVSSATTIDHWITRSDLDSRILSTKVANNALSDHRTVTLTVLAKGMPFSKKRLNVNRAALKQNGVRKALVRNNRFQALLDQASFIEGNELVAVDKTELDDLFKGFTEAASAALRDVGAVHDEIAAPRGHLPARVKRSIEKFRLLQREEAGKGDRASEATLREARRAARKAVKQESSRRFQALLKRGPKLLKQGDGKGFWAWANAVSLRSSRKPLGLRPIRDANGDLAVSPDGICEAWAGYFEDLLSSGPEPDLEAALADMPDSFPPLAAHRPLLWPEFARALKSLLTSKAAGTNAIPAELLKAALPNSPSKPNEQEAEDEIGKAPHSPLAALMFAIAKSMFHLGHVPETMRPGLCLPIPKKRGDLESPSSYRGITVLDSLLKAVSVVIRRRLDEAMDSEEGAPLLYTSQAGFRRNEEVVAQLVALYDLCHRRRQNNITTYLVFIDFKKAFDKVDHAILKEKMKRSGLDVSTLGLITSLYDDLKVSVAAAGLISRPVTQARGVSQGNPTSPALFNFYANEKVPMLLREGTGVMTPGAPDCIAGLEVADDLALLAESVEEAKKQLQLVDEWARRNGLELHLDKCQGMVVAGVKRNDSKGEREQRQAEKVDELNKAMICLSGKRLPCNRSYEYLGFAFHDNLDLTPMAISIRKRVKKKVDVLSRFLRDHRIPLDIKRLVASGAIWGAAAYGGELLGMRSPRLAGVVDSELMRAVQMMVISSKGKMTAKYEVALTELGLPSAHAMWAGQRARAVAKFPTLRTEVAQLVNDPTVKSTWRSESEKFLAEMVDWFLTYMEPTEAQAKAVTNRENPSNFGRAIKWAVMARQLKNPLLPYKGAPRKTQPAVSLVQYVGANFGTTKGFIKAARGKVALADGFRWLVRLRVGSFWFTPQMLKAKIFYPDKLKELKAASIKCVFCNQTTAEDLPHFLCRCKAFRRQRKKYLNYIIQPLRTHFDAYYRSHDYSTLTPAAVESILFPGFREKNVDLAVAISLLGGGVFTNSWKKDVSKMCVDGNGAGASLEGTGAKGGGHWTVLQSVAVFLAEVMPVRRKLLLESGVLPSTNADTTCGRRSLKEYGSTDGVT